jgi:hypothetical protein
MCGDCVCRVLSCLCCRVFYCSHALPVSCLPLSISLLALLPSTPLPSPRRCCVRQRRPCRVTHYPLGHPGKPRARTVQAQSLVQVQAQAQAQGQTQVGRVLRHHLAPTHLSHSHSRSRSHRPRPRPSSSRSSSRARWPSRDSTTTPQTTSCCRASSGPRGLGRGRGQGQGLRLGLAARRTGLR